MSYTTEALLNDQWTPKELEEEHECQRQQELDDYFNEVLQEEEAAERLFWDEYNGNTELSL